MTIQDKIVTEAMTNAGATVLRDIEEWCGTWADGKRASERIYTAMSTAQEPALDDDAEWLLSHAKYVKSLIGAGKGSLFFDADIEKLECIADRLQAKAPETGEG